MKGYASILALCAALSLAQPAFAAGPDGPESGRPPQPGFCEARPHDGGRPPHPGMPVHRGHPLELAGLLSSMETGIGIRADQLDAWRQYTDAVQAMMQPPQPPKRQEPEAFAMAAAMATHLAEKSKKAEMVLAAIDKLRKTLTPEQIERAKRLEPPAPLPPSVQDAQHLDRVPPVDRHGPGQGMPQPW